MLKFAAFTTVLSMLAQNAFAELAANEDFQNGMQALTLHLPEVAEQKFQKVLKEGELDPNERKRLLILLVEAQVRSFAGAEAEKTLAFEELKGSLDRQFWLGQAFFVQGRHRDAVRAFEKVIKDEKHPRYGLALLALSELYRSLNQPRKSFDVLERAAEATTLSAAANLRLVEAYIDKKRFKNAETLLASIETQREEDSRQKQFFTAVLLNAKGMGDQAFALLQPLRENEEIVGDLRIGVTLAMVDALIVQKKNTEAAEILTRFISEAPQSPVLHLAYNRLLVLLEKNTIDKIDEPIRAWIETPLVDPENKEKMSFKFADRDAFSRYTLASLLGPLPASREQALTLLEQLRKYHSSHSLARRSLLLTSQLYDAAGNKEGALKALDELYQSALSDELKAQALFAKALLQKKYGGDEDAAKSFAKLAKTKGSDLAESAQVNLALLRLARNDEQGFFNAAKLIQNEKIRVGLMFERGILRLEQGDIKARKDLFILLEYFDNHPLAATVELRLAKSLLAQQPIDVEKANKLLASLKERKLSKQMTAELELVSARSKLIGGNWEQLVTEYEEQLKNLEETSPNNIEAIQKMSLSLGEAYFRNNQFNNARKIFNKVSQIEGSTYGDYARFFSALAAVKEGTPQGKEDSIKLLKQVVNGNGVFASEAVLQLSRLLLDEQNIEETEELLTEWLAKKDISDAVRFDLRLMLADLWHRKGIQEGGDLAFVAKAINIYTELIAEVEGDPVSWNRVMFLKGEAEEKVDPSFKLSLATYFAVVNLEGQEDKSQPAEWEWYYKAGLRAVDLLEEQERWKPAILLLERMASYFGPMSDVLLERADRMKLEQHIWLE